MPVKYVRIDGIATFLHHRGRTTLPDEPPDLARGETLLCVHSERWTGQSFADVMDALASSHSPLAFDLPGHGRSGGLDSLGSIERMTDHTRALVEKLGVGAAVVIGHSMGAAVAIEYALRHPQDVRALVLCSGATRSEIPDALVERIRRVTEGKERRFFSRELYSKDAAPDVLQAGFREDSRTDPRVLFGDLLALREWDGTSRLGALRAPTLVLCGEHDAASARAAAEGLASGIGGATLQPVAGAGHALLVEQPAAVARAIAAFVDGLPR